VYEYRTKLKDYRDQRSDMVLVIYPNSNPDPKRESTGNILRSEKDIKAQVNEDIKIVEYCMCG
jgi:hypothetical protein